MLLSKTIKTILTSIFDIDYANDTNKIEYFRFKDKSISTDQFYMGYDIDYQIKKPYLLVGYYFDNQQSGESHRLYSLEINYDHFSDFTYGKIIMQKDYKLPITACKIFYDLNILVCYYDMGIVTIAYDSKMIARNIAIDDILQ